MDSSTKSCSRKLVSCTLLGHPETLKPHLFLLQTEKHWTLSLPKEVWYGYPKQYVLLGNVYSLLPSPKWRAFSKIWWPESKFVNVKKLYCVMCMSYAVFLKFHWLFSLQGTHWWACINKRLTCKSSCCVLLMSNLILRSFRFISWSTRRFSILVVKAGRVTSTSNCFL